MTESPNWSRPLLDDSCGEHFTYRDLIECGETQAKYKIANLPQEPESYEALKALASNILDPVWKKFGPVKLTYGFSSVELIKRIPGRNAPYLDQHAAHEKRRTGNPVCKRLGAACDFRIENWNMRQVAEWTFLNTPIDRLYFYGPDNPIHVSFSNTRAHKFVNMLLQEDGRRIPRVDRSLKAV